jgi:hypothetical protein
VLRRKAKDRLYNRRCRELRRRSPDRRMGSVSDDGADTTTVLERGPQDPGDIDKTTVPYSDAGAPFGGVDFEDRSKPCEWEGSMLNCQVPGV